MLKYRIVDIHAGLYFPLFIDTGVGYNRKGKIYFGKEFSGWNFWQSKRLTNKEKNKMF